MALVLKNKIRFVFLVVFACVTFGSLAVAFLFSSRDSQDKEVFAQETKPMVCRKQPEVSFSLPLIGQIAFKAGPNSLEIPTGEATDETEDIAQKIIDELQKIVDAAGKASAAATQMSQYAGECSLANCTTPGCQEIVERGCLQQMCSGNACPHRNEISQKLSEIQTSAGEIGTSYNKINDLLTKKDQRPIGGWEISIGSISLKWCLACETILNTGACIPPPGFCRTKIESIEEKLEKARSGDYKIFNGVTEVWNSEPPGLKDCVIRPTDIEEILAGRKAGKFLMSCETALSAGVLDEEDCYGNVACEAAVSEGKTPPEFCPRLENYYCCE